MGGRVEGKKKKKSIKANVTSKFGSKRRLSRMGKKVKKGQAGPSTEFITRSAALKKLQITLKDFRRLCILKGIYPRVPEKGLKGNDKIYYDIKDISYIMHEPLLEKFREFKTFMRKIRKSSGRNEIEDARRKNQVKPKISLDHLVKERYPRFLDALRDLDDALCTGRITPEKTLTCNELARQWQYYISKSRSLQKVFVSVKGVYYQAEVMGEAITWLVPHQFTQSLPKEVDLRVMITFLEFYEIFLKFVLFKLYHMQGMQYPPLVDKRLLEEGCYLLAMRSGDEAAKGAEGTNSGAAVPETKAVKAKEEMISVDKQTQEKLKSLPALLDAMDGDDEEDEEGLGELSGPLEAAFQDLQGDDEVDGDGKVFVYGEEGSRNNIFSKLYFFVNREVPLEWLQFCILSFGGRIGWEGSLSPYGKDDERITHHVIDRPVQGLKLDSRTREYVQPQWVFDSINARMLLPTSNYAPGAKLPPHLSPFVDDEKEGYVPSYREEIAKLQQKDVPRVEKEELEPSDDDDEEGEDSSGEGESDSEEESAAMKEQAAPKNTAQTKGGKGVLFQPKALKQSEAAEEKDLSKLMMSNKTKRLYDKMKHSVQKRQDTIEKLEAKRKLAEEKQEEAPSRQSKRAKK